LTELVPNPGQIGETLERVLASATFARSDRARKLLRYLVDQQLSGQADRLKGFSIAVDVFGKDADYDPSTDAIVRVQAGRLRELLDQYFAGEGSTEPVRITIPRGNYIPSYALTASEAPASISVTAPVEAIAAPPVVRISPKRRKGLALHVNRQLRLFWAAFGVVFALLGFVAWNSWRDANFEMTMSANAAPALRVADAAVSLPHVFLHVGDDEASRRAGAVMRTALTGFDTIVYIARPAPGTGDAAALDFAFDLAPGPTQGSVNVTLQNVRSGEVIMSRVISDRDLEADRIDDVIADVITATLPVSGALYAYLEANDLERGITRCLLLNDDYYLDQTKEKHRAAYDCFDGMLKAGAHSPLIFSELAALQLETVTDKYGYPPNASLDNGLQLARRAVQMAPTSPYAHRAYGFLYTRMGITGEALKWMEKAYRLGRYDFNMAAAYGYALIMSGNYDDGTPVIYSAVTNSSARPSWWDYTLFLGAMMTGQLGLAADATDSLTATRRPHYLAARLLAASHRDQEEDVNRLRAELAEKHKKFVTDPRGYYERADYPADMIERLVNALREAGLAVGS
jgi:tetratricopeptide (TPR) repeat protein